MEEKSRILVVVAHPDDEVLGCGGTIAKEVSLGSEVFVLILGDGETSRGQENLEEKIKQKSEASQKASQILGIKAIFSENFPDNSFDTVALLEITKAVERFISAIKPSIIFTHHHSDLNIDHQITFQAVLIACRPMPGSLVKKILSFETLSSTEWQAKKSHLAFCPNFYSEITDFFDQKIKAMECYSQELRLFPHPRSKEGIGVLAKYRGMESGLEMAEAFEIIREINNQKQNPWYLTN